MSIRTSSEISKENMEDLKSQFGKAISLLPGKSESFLMISFEDNCKLYFRGNNQEDIAFVEVKLFGKADKASCDKLTAKISDILEDKLRIKPSQVYIRYQDTEIWGCNGSNF